MRKFIWDVNHRGKPFKRKYFIPEERFWEALLSLSRRVKGCLKSECLEWLGRKNKRGYGSVHFRGKDRRVNRVTWMLHYGEIPPNKEVCHHCDNPPCFEPSHLFLGSHTDNMRDAAAKKRLKSHQGESHGMAKLTNSEVLKIRKLYKRGPYFHGKLTAEQIGKRFGITRDTVYLIINRSTWKHI